MKFNLSQIIIAVSFAVVASGAMAGDRRLDGFDPARASDAVSLQTLKDFLANKPDISADMNTLCDFICEAAFINQTEQSVAESELLSELQFGTSPKLVAVPMPVPAALISRGQDSIAF